MRPQWSGVTSVDVYGGFGLATDWAMPFLTLTNDGSGTFTGTKALANGTYNYYFRTQGSADNLVSNGHYFLDQENPGFAPHPAGAPLMRSVSTVTVPQAATPLYHLKGVVLFNGHPQPCYSIDLEAGELRSGNMVLSEHTTANFAESAADGTFDFTVAAGELGVTVRYPFLLSGASAAYPDPAVTPSVGVARTTVTLAASLTLDPVEVSYPDYSAMSPTGGTASLPVTFHFTLIPGSAAGTPAVISTSIAGNDPAWWLPFGTATTVTWDGGFSGASGAVVLGTKYWWGAWQQRTPVAGGTQWTEESLLFPITFN